MARIKENESKIKGEIYMLDVKVNDDYKLVSDGMQIVIYRKNLIDPAKSPKFDPKKHSSEKREEFKPYKYASSIEHALDIILKQNILESDAKNLKELSQEIKAFKKYVKELIVGE